MHPDDHICLCFRVSLRKIRTYLKREDPKVASLISECLSAGTGCGWCVPFLKHLHAQHQRGETPDLASNPADYASARKTYRDTGERPQNETGPHEGGPGDSESDSAGDDQI
ncbi:MAG: (2Fe-2S)-binding protein [Planctomycetota bacterium]